MVGSERFDQQYFERFYMRPSTRVAEPAYFDRLGRFIGAYVTLLEYSVATILDVGCGLGALRPALQHCFPNAHYTGIDISADACERCGWLRASIVDFEPAGAFDLIVCHDVLQYLDRREAKKAISNLRRLCTGVLYFGVLTREDWLVNCDQQRTDRNVYLRPARWYAKRLRRSFRSAGGGIYVNRSADIVLYELEHLDGFIPRAG